MHAYYDKTRLTRFRDRHQQLILAKQEKATIKTITFKRHKTLLMNTERPIYEGFHD